MTWRLIEADCIEAMASMDEASVDAIVTDPPYGLEFMGKEWDRLWNEPDSSFTERPKGGTGPFDRRRASFGADTKAMQRWHEEWARAAYRVLKPGGHLLAFGGTRTYHRLACALEDAGFEIRDCLAWLYGSGFPKSLNLNGEHQGWGTALKPAFEPIVLARKPLIGSVAQNVLEHGTGALNIDGTRIEGDPDRPRGLRADGTRGQTRTTGLADRPWMHEEQRVEPDGASGRWPANVLLDEEAAGMLDEQSGERGGSGRASGPTLAHLGDGGIYGKADGQRSDIPFYGDSGGASRFFYIAKADREERNRGLGHREAVMVDNSIRRVGQEQPQGNPNLSPTANHHPTVKPVELMQWLCRLITPPKGTILDPFTGSGSTGIAALREGFSFIGIEREHDYVEIARDRTIGDSPLFNPSEEVTA